MIKQRHLAPERQQQLRELLRQEGVMRVDDLCGKLRVSAATIRRDLEALERRGRIRRVHGGAVSVESRLDEPLFDEKTSVAAREKRRIAEHAAALVQPGDTVYLDGGSTVLELARLLRERTNITVVTNSLRAAIELSGSGPDVILVGGQLRRRSQTLVGALTRCVLEQLHVDKAFMGTIGFSLKEGTTTTDPSEAFTKELVIGQAGRVYLLVDSGKADKVSFARAGRLTDFDVVITDSSLPDRFAKALRKQGIELVQV